jgi:hypothetical protein
VIPSNPTRATQRRIDTHIYKERCLGELLPAHQARSAMRFEELARNFLSFVHLTAILVWVR